MQKNVILDHRKDVGRNRALAMKLMDALEAEVDSPEVFGELGELVVQYRRSMADPEDKDAQRWLNKLEEAFQKVLSLPSQVDSVKKLAETLKVLIALEREAFGIDKTVGDKNDEIERTLERAAALIAAKNGS